MVTKAKLAAAPAAPEPAAAPVGQAHLKSIWRVKLPAGVTSWGSRSGWELLDRTEADALIASGDAVDPWDPLYNGLNLPFREGEEPRGAPPFTPPRSDYTVAVTGFTAATPSVATMSGTDAAKLRAGDVLAMDATAGDPAAQALVDGHNATVASVTGTGCTLTGIALAGQDVTALVGTGAFNAP